ncbi:hypothetical protein E2562_028067 [Oryza meyeriana var. granulata]|uniref:Uncharacterized protein n=1 Tax=Oryza meyeriana var. granulata TaxID=110450 RepID=A0A6G1C0E5_9ORYZ|nr:hypothetical protein E2562_028067 [Oryza meyeriana var. granulata]
MDSQGNSEHPDPHLEKVLTTMNSTTLEKLNLNFIGEGKPLIQKVPAFLRSIENADRLFTPDIVAIGPCHRDNSNLQGMEAIKKMAAMEFCCSSQHKLRVFYHNVRMVAAHARACYAHDLSEIGDDEFADMMFYDGCFLLQFMKIMARDRGPPVHWTMPRLSENMVRRISRDILLVENQVPWVVLEALMSLNYVHVDRYIAAAISEFDVQWAKPHVDFEGADRYQPFHLLDLVRHRQLGPVPSQEVDEAPRPMLNISSAMELAEVGIQLTASKTARFADIGVGKGPLMGKLWLPPVFLGELTMCWLTNMAAFEMLQGGTSDYGVSSYVQIMAVLMNRPDDVRELRTKRIVYPVLSDQQTLDFFKSICRYLPYGQQYKRVLQQLSDYHHHRPVRVTLHKFVYTNFKYILTAGSAFGFLIPILKAILSLKQNKPSSPGAPPHA